MLVSEKAPGGAWEQRANQVVTARRSAWHRGMHRGTRLARLAIPIRRPVSVLWRAP